MLHFEDVFGCIDPNYVPWNGLDYHTRHLKVNETAFSKHRFWAAQGYSRSLSAISSSEMAELLRGYKLFSGITPCWYSPLFSWSTLMEDDVLYGMGWWSVIPQVVKHGLVSCVHLFYIWSVIIFYFLIGEGGRKVKPPPELRWFCKKIWQPSIGNRTEKVVSASAV